MQSTGFRIGTLKEQIYKNLMKFTKDHTVTVGRDVWRLSQTPLPEQAAWDGIQMGTE